jgi:hypothetical protein
MIPSSSAAYSQARQEIRSWKNELIPPVNNEISPQETNFYN